MKYIGDVLAGRVDLPLKSCLTSGYGKLTRIQTQPPYQTQLSNPYQTHIMHVSTDRVLHVTANLGNVTTTADSREAQGTPNNTRTASLLQFMDYLHKQNEDMKQEDQATGQYDMFIGGESYTDFAKKPPIQVLRGLKPVNQNKAQPSDAEADQYMSPEQYMATYSVGAGPFSPRSTHNKPHPGMAFLEVYNEKGAADVMKFILKILQKVLFFVVKALANVIGALEQSIKPCLKYYKIPVPVSVARPYTQRGWSADERTFMPNTDFYRHSSYVQGLSIEHLVFVWLRAGIAPSSAVVLQKGHQREYSGPTHSYYQQNHPHRQDS